MNNKDIKKQMEMNKEDREKLELLIKALKEIVEYECICRHENYHTQECKRHNRLKRMYMKRTLKRKFWREHNCCIFCGEKVTPQILYPQYCDKHKKYNPPKKKIEVKAK